MPGSILGMFKASDFTAGNRPNDWRSRYLFLEPNGMAPLTALTSRMRSESASDQEFKWQTKSYQSQTAAVTGRFTDTGLSVAYTSGGVKGDTLYMRMAEASAEHFRSQHEVLLRDASHLDVDVRAKVTTVVRNGASSYIGVKLLEADDNGAATDLSDCDTAIVIGNINPEGGALPDAITYNPVEWVNYVQTFRTPLDITRIARRTQIRGGNEYAEKKRESFQYHMKEIELGLVWGIKTKELGSNGAYEYTTQGLVDMIRENVPLNTSDYSRDSNFSGQNWITGGRKFLNTYFERMVREGGQTRLVFCGTGALLGIDELANVHGYQKLEPMQIEFGLRVTQWVMPVGTFYLYTHPLFSQQDTMRNSMLVCSMEDMIYKHIDDTDFYECPEKQVSTNGQRLDKTVEEWLTDCGVEIHFPSKFGFLQGVGLDNVV